MYPKLCRRKCCEVTDGEGEGLTINVHRRQETNTVLATLCKVGGGKKKGGGGRQNRAHSRL